ncbi:uncharacterized protein N7469_011526 [Penicillium citrinum]|uniref:Calcineurin-like phosphoesterase domain-containing protein n=1 Tax=Penicillium citrinum TaxID=5077 RepID=A0A9W9NDK9_PENCI|nr:uncharacterized protein N7469_011526 [Penicillium citrinum]KAJ5217901.1 hypothetical protein N7469_011526 [Penicillium citrinum]
MRRKTRFVCVSDTHGYLPAEAGFKLPTGDVLIHAGDLTNNGSTSELRRTMDWISKADFEIKILVAGNHDVSLDPEFYSKNGHTFHGNRLEDHRKCMDIVTGAAPSVVLLRHQAAVIRLTRENGPRTAFTVFGSPHSQFKGSWAFGYGNDEAAALWDQIPPEVDIVVTHTPPQSYCDRKPAGKFVGCNALRQRLSDIRPPLAICGHVHEGRGYIRVRWRNGDGDADIQPGHEAEVVHGALPPRTSKKLNLVDLTNKRGDCLDNHGFSCEISELQPLSKTITTPMSLLPDIAESAVDTVPDEQSHQGSQDNEGSSSAAALPSNSDTKLHSLGSLRLLRKETCIVNAAIMASSWPHQGGKQFNAPIVVDIELPVWQSGPDVTA